MSRIDWRHRLLLGVALWPLLALAACSSRQPVPTRIVLQPEIEKATQRFAAHGVTGAFVLLYPSSSTDPASPPRSVTIASGDAAQRRTLPASTFKIPNTLIGLKTGAVKTDEIFRWDGKPRASKEWERDLNLTEAFRTSCVPCYQELARRVGIQRMLRSVREIGYGNAEIGGAVDLFWLEGPLVISVQEEAEFVRRVYLGELPFERRHLEFVKSAMKIEETPSYRLFAKTGWANRTEPNVGWYVGWIETEDGPSFFATRALSPSDRSELVPQVRKELTLELLKDLGVIR